MFNVPPQLFIFLVVNSLGIFYLFSFYKSITNFLQMLWQTCQLASGFFQTVKCVTFVFSHGAFSSGASGLQLRLELVALCHMPVLSVTSSGFALVLSPLLPESYVFLFFVLSETLILQIWDLLNRSSISQLFNMVSPSHLWLLSIWNVDCPNWAVL